MIYFIQCFLGKIKIGHDGEGEDGDVWRRLAELQTGNPYPLTLLAVMPGGEKEERRLHGTFEKCRMKLDGRKTEWFEPEPKLIDYILRHGAFPYPDEPEMRRRVTLNLRPRRFRVRFVRQTCDAKRVIAARDELTMQFEQCATCQGRGRVKSKGLFDP